MIKKHKHTLTPKEEAAVLDALNTVFIGKFTKVLSEDAAGYLTVKNEEGPDFIGHKNRVLGD